MELMVDYITSLDGYGAAEGWPGWWGLESPEYLAWLGEDSKNQHTLLMGANTYRLMHSFAPPDDADDMLGRMQKIVFSNTLQEPLEMGELPTRPRRRRRGRTRVEGDQ